MQADAEQYGRPLSIEDYSNRFIVHPLSDAVVKLALPLKISANAVSVTGLAFGLAAGLFYFHQSNWLYALAGFACMFIWHVLDGADGRIARATNSTSSLGRIIDGVCDHLVFASVYFGFVFYLLSTGSSNTVWLLAIAAAISHALQSAAYEERRQKYHRRLNGLDREAIAKELHEVAGKKSLLAKAYDAVQKLSVTKTSPLDDYLQKNNPNNDPKINQRIAAQTVPLVRAWGLLNANNRTILLAITALFGHPEWYFLIEIIGLNLVFIGLLFFERYTENKIVSTQQIAEQ
ncbi:CDP-alcohol phosphatidyltransferase family protein [Oceanicaulis sp. AH-315-P02]|nr:CDP-alcohol phosphatidyltransferase family protein [Robiginitomaculum sp.]MBN4047734.1 CDP-alcohol phosphatidyltransferase family protein [Oceanicaulis sp. AH-315-P02]